MQKLRQITDNVHETIYLSDFESELMSTPYFYRLHDIYQSSTVYMTFPTNRTKRYEHSIGTMHLAGEIFFSAISNAEKEAKEELLKVLKEDFDEYIIKNIVKSSGYNNVTYLSDKAKTYIGNIFDKYDPTKAFRQQVPEWDNNVLNNAISKQELFELGLKQYTMSFTDLKDDEDEIKNVFVYQCILEAIRIVALFHDAGHPPFSHVIEDVLLELYDVCLQNEENGKLVGSFAPVEARELYENVRSLKENDLKQILSLKDTTMENLTNSFEKMDFHEQVGAKFFQTAIKNVIDDNLDKLMHNVESSGYEFVEAKILYLITVVEYAFSILQERDMNYAMLHRIIDGSIDADRLDYIVRDTRNSGVDWGKIPYTRIVASAKLTRYYIKNTQNSFFVVAYPEKIVDDIDDLLELRYKIFSRINFHHRCQKTAVTLKTVVKELAIDYLESCAVSSDDKLAICPEISLLWKSLGAGSSSRPLNVIQWNDSWMITTLYQALINISDERRCVEFLEKYDKEANQKGISINKEEIKEKFARIKGLLQEILLNKKYYTTVFKRECDWSNFLKSILEESGISSKVASLKVSEKEKYEKNFPNGEEKNMGKIDNWGQARNSLGRFALLDIALNQGNVPLFETIFPMKKSVEELFKDSLDTAKKEGLIKDYALIYNPKFSATKLPSWTDAESRGKGIYLYNSREKEAYIYDVELKLKSRLNSFIKFGTWMSVYIVLTEDSSRNNEKFQKVVKYLSEGLKAELINKYNELFPSNKLTDNEI